MTMTWTLSVQESRNVFSVQFRKVDRSRNPRDGTNFVILPGDLDCYSSTNLVAAEQSKEPKPFINFDIKAALR